MGLHTIYQTTTYAMLEPAEPIDPTRERFISEDAYQDDRLARMLEGMTAKGRRGGGCTRGFELTPG